MVSQIEAAAAVHRITMLPTGERALREAAIGAGHDSLAPDDFGEAKEALGDELGVLDDVGRVRNQAGYEDLVFGKLYVLPHLPLVLVARIGGLEAIGADVYPQHEVD